MPHNESELIAANRAQYASEVDDFTEERYAQFFRHLPPDAVSVLDVGCNTGRGGAVLKRLAPALQIDGLDCVPERLNAVQDQIYDRRICSFSHLIDTEAGFYDAIVAGVLLDPSHVMQHYPERLRKRLMDVGFSDVTILGSGRVSRRLGERFPILPVYGSYLILATKW